MEAEVAQHLHDMITVLISYEGVEGKTRKQLLSDLYAAQALVESHQSLRLVSAYLCRSSVSTETIRRLRHQQRPLLQSWFALSAVMVRYYRDRVPSAENPS